MAKMGPKTVPGKKILKKAFQGAGACQKTCFLVNLASKSTASRTENTASRYETAASRRFEKIYGYP